MPHTSNERTNKAFCIWGFTNLLSTAFLIAYTTRNIIYDRNEFSADAVFSLLVIGFIISVITMPVIPIVFRLLSAFEEDSPLVFQGVLMLLAFSGIAFGYTLLITGMLDERVTIDNLRVAFLILSPYIGIATLVTMLIGRRRVPLTGD